MHRNTENKAMQYNTENVVLCAENRISRNLAVVHGNNIRILNKVASIITRKPYRLNNTEIVETEIALWCSIVQENAAQGKEFYSNTVRTRKTVGRVNFGNNAGVLTTTPLYRSWKWQRVR